jgi:hypothetical protein
VATSRAVPGRQIGQADSPDRVFLGYFVKKNPQILAKSTRSPTSSLNFYCKKTLELFKKQPAIQPFLWADLLSRWAGLPSAWAALSAVWPEMGKKQPMSLFSFCTV